MNVIFIKNIFQVKMNKEYIDSVILNFIKEVKYHTNWLYKRTMCLDLINEILNDMEKSHKFELENYSKILSNIIDSSSDKEVTQDYVIERIKILQKENYF